MSTGEVARPGPDPKPAKRKRASKAEWERIRSAFANKVCVSCANRINLELHHVVPRSQGGSDVVENLCPLCHDCHMQLEDHGQHHAHVAACVRSYVWARASRLNYAIERLGADRFDKRYPAPPHLAFGDLSPHAGPLELPRDAA